ncbi:Amidohydrolase 2 [uncultured delta proteobacterium]|uniref:Amidohydrolase 2 n=1 Tax=uncultured delta proteobacterium TaxID=34034 RepID=A0A212JJ90_9DELT|nr:Amidohydrolase 2 [uncultured delta proteobacterium]
MFTDIHTHVFHPAVAAKAVARLAALGFTPPGTGTLEDLLARAERAGIGRVVCHTTALTADQVIPANNFAVGLARRESARDTGPAVVCFGSVHPDFARWTEELDRLEKAGVPGIKIHPNFQNLAFDDPRLFPVMEAVGERFILMCHVGCEKPLEANPASPYKLAKLIALFPKARIIAAHLGGYADGVVALDALAGKDIWLDTSNTARTGEAAARAVIARHPFERLLFGSDYPLFDPGEEIPKQQQRFAFSDAQMEALMRNADALLG